MNWIQAIANAIQYIENHLTDDISIEDVSNQVYASSSYFQFVFHVVTGITIGEYIRNRRLSLAATDLLQSKNKIIDVAMRYRYDTQESFSKAFKRFHGMPPSKIQRGQAQRFYPLTVNVTIQGGFDMSHRLIDEFYLLDWGDITGKKHEMLTASEKYKKIVDWALKARGRNPNVFDELTEWILDDSQWEEDKLAENEQILMHGVFARFREQNTKLKSYLKELESSGVVNAPVFDALDRFDDELSGISHEKNLHDVVEKMFDDFSVMKERSIREQIAGNKTGPTGTDSVDIFGYINHLKNCDAEIQWTLFMPDVVKNQQKGFKVKSFEYKKMPAMRFIGQEDDGTNNVESRKKLFTVLDTLCSQKQELGYDIFLMHHYGLCVDVGPWHGFWGRFMPTDTPTPEEFISFDFVPDSDGKDGFPFISQYAYATFSGDMQAMHKREGYDVDAMYDITRNIILGQCVNIPYPEKYWTAEVFPEGFEKQSTAYMFSVDINI